MNRKNIAYLSLVALIAISFAAVGSISAQTDSPSQAATPLATLAGTQPATDTVTQSTTPHPSQDIRNTRYCEVLPINLKQGKLVASVYNTLGQNDCPQAVWKAFDVTAIKKQFSAVDVVLNGPRYWMMDTIIGKGISQNGPTVMIGGLGFTKRAEVDVTLSSLKATPYQERNINRDTEYIFKAGKPIYELHSPDGHTYVMQTYSQQADPTLSIDDLPKLGDRLKLPIGWTYEQVNLDKDLTLSANGVAHLIQDDLDNSYQRIEPTDLVPATEIATEASTQPATQVATMAVTS